MNKNILFFSVNRHQKKYFDYLINAVKQDDHGTSLHKREMIATVPSFSFSQNDIKISREVCAVRAQYSENKTGIKAGLFKRVFYLLTSLFFLLKVKSLLTKNSFDIVLLWNDMKWHQYVIKKIASRYSIKTAFFENGALPNTVTFDAKGVNFNNSVPRIKDFYLKDRGNSDSGEDVPSDFFEFRTDIVGYVFAPFQVDYDTQIITHSPWLSNMGEFYQVLEEYLTVLPKGMKIFIKEHPASSRSYHDLHNKNPNIVFKNNTNTDELIENSEFVVTINSTVGLESILKSKPVLTLGNAFYAIEGLCSGMKSKDEFVNKKQSLIYPNKSMLSNFASYLSNEYYISGDWRKPTPEHVLEIEKRLYEYLQ